MLKRVSLLAILFALFMQFCSNDKKDDNSRDSGSEDDNGTRYGKVTLKSAATTALTTAAATNCAKSMDIYRLEGACLTPSQFSGYVMKVDLLSDIAGSPPTRIMSLDEDEATAGVIFAGKEVALDSIGKSLVGNNLLTTAYQSKPDFKGVAVDFAYRKFTISIQNKYVTVLIPSYEQPFASAATSLCGFSSEVAEQQRYKDADLISGMTFKRGDYLFCVKDTSTSSCSASDYQWLDKSSNILTSTRPANPKNSAYLAGTAITCSADNERYGFNIKNAPVYATIASTFKLYGDYSHGSHSVENNGAQQPFNDSQYSAEGGVNPYVYYTYNNNKGTTTSGTELAMSLAFGVTDSVVVEGLRATDLDTKSMGEILSSLSEISLWVHDKKFADRVDGGFTSHYAAMTAEAAVTLSGDKNPPKSKESL